MKKDTIYIILIVIISLSIVACSVYQYIYKKHRNIALETIDYTLSSNNLKHAMQVDSTSSVLIDKVIETKGIITAIEQNSVIINDAIQVNFLNTDVSHLKPSTTLNIKGRCVGYDDLLEIVKIDQATIINQ